MRSSSLGTSILEKKTLFFLVLLSFPVFNLTEVDKTGLTPELNNTLDKAIRIIWFLATTTASLAIFRNLFTSRLTSPSPIILILYSYITITIVSLIINSSGPLGYYRATEYSLLLFGVATLDKAATTLGSEKAADILAKTVFLVSIIALGILIIGFLINKDHVYGLETQGRARLGGNAYSPNQLGILFCLGAISTLYLKLKNVIHLSKMAVLALLIGFIVSIYLTGSRTAAGCFALSASYFLFISIKPSYRAITLLLATFLTLIIITTFVLADASLSLANFASLIGKGETPLDDLLTLNNRTVVADVGLTGFYENPYFGVGLVEGVKEYYKQNFTQDFWLPPHTHNSFLETMLSTGIISFILLTSTYLYLVHKIALAVLLQKKLSQNYLHAAGLTLALASWTLIVFGGTYSYFTLWYFSIIAILQRKNAAPITLHS